MEVSRRRPVRSVRGQSFQALEVEEAAAHFVRARLGDDVDHAARRAPELRIRAVGHDLEFLHGLKRDVDRRTLAAKLLAEESIVVVAAIKADVVVHASLPTERDLIAVRSLDDAHPGGQREQILKLAAQNGCGADGGFIEGVTDLRPGDVDERRSGDGDGLRCS